MRLKSNWEQIKNVHTDFETIDDDFWDQVEELVDTLEFPYLATKAMEKRDFCYTDLYLWWLRMELKFDEIIADSPKFNFASTLKRNIEARKAALFNTPIMMTALYLDPRFKNQLTTEKTAVAAETLQKLFIQTKSKPAPSPHPGLNAIDRQIEAQVLNTCNHTQQNEANWRAELTMAMSNYNTARITDINRTALEFWKENKSVYPQLYELSRIIFSIASSISETERTFSAFSYIYNVRRQNLLPENVKNILMIRLNKDIFYQLREDKINKIRNQYLLFRQILYLN